MKAQFKNRDDNFSVEVEKAGDKVNLHYLEKNIKGQILEWNPPFCELEIEGNINKAAFFRGKDFIDIHLPQGNFRLNYLNKKREGSKAHPHAGELTAPMPGKILKVLVGQGDQVKKGDALMVLEAMKMEHKIVSPFDGEVGRVFFKEGERVGQDAELLEIA